MPWYSGQSSCGCNTPCPEEEVSPCSILSGVTESSLFTVEIGNFVDSFCFCDQYDGTYTLHNDPDDVNQGCMWGTGGSIFDPFLDLDPDPDTGANCDVSDIRIIFSGTANVGLTVQLNTAGGTYFGSTTIGPAIYDATGLDITFQGIGSFGTNGGISVPANFNRPCTISSASFMRVKLV